MANAAGTSNAAPEGAHNGMTSHTADSDPIRPPDASASAAGSQSPVRAIEAYRHPMAGEMPDQRREQTRAARIGNERETKKPSGGTVKARTTGAARIAAARIRTLSVFT